MRSRLVAYLNPSSVMSRCRIFGTGYGYRLLIPICAVVVSSVEVPSKSVSVSSSVEVIATSGTEVGIETAMDDIGKDNDIEDYIGDDDDDNEVIYLKGTLLL